MKIAEYLCHCERSEAIPLSEPMARDKLSV
jgi:hypothetical protein